MKMIFELSTLFLDFYKKLFLCYVNTHTVLRKFYTFYSVEFVNILSSQIIHIDNNERFNKTHIVITPCIYF